jgi:hypothetical protein
MIWRKLHAAYDILLEVLAVFLLVDIPVHVRMTRPQIQSEVGDRIVFISLDGYRNLTVQPVASQFTNLFFL